MASPQLADGYLRLANELQEQLMVTKFNREQRAILDLILRLSYGCRKKTAVIPKQRYFALVGVFESHVARELKRLETAGVIRVNRETGIYELNKNYETWRVSLAPDYDAEVLQKLVALNLQISKETYSEVSYEPENLQISKSELTNKEVFEPANPHSNAISEAPKNNIKDSTTNNALSNDERELLSILKSIPGYSFNFDRDLEHVRSLAVDFPAVNLLNEAKRYKAWLIDHPLKKKSNPRLQFRNWCERSLNGFNKKISVLQGNTGQQLVAGRGDWTPPEEL